MANNTRYIFQSVPLAPRVIYCVRCKRALWTGGFWIEITDRQTGARYALGRDSICTNCNTKQVTEDIELTRHAVDPKVNQLNILGLGTHPPPLIPLDQPEQSGSVEVDLSDLDDGE